MHAVCRFRDSALAIAVVHGSKLVLVLTGQHDPLTDHSFTSLSADLSEVFVNKFEDSGDDKSIKLVILTLL